MTLMSQVFFATQEERSLPGLGCAALRSRQLSALSDIPECLKTSCRAGAAARAGVRALGGWGSHPPSELRHSHGSGGLRRLEGLGDDACEGAVHSPPLVTSACWSLWTLRRS